MYSRAHHQKIYEVLQRLDDQVLKNHACYFGGGTAIALMNGEYRESVDIDFLISDLARYRSMRELLVGAQGIKAITKVDREIVLAREIKADQYSIRTILRMGDSNIKFEIISEGRISFDEPKSKDKIGDVFTLSRLDLVASKLLANADRWRDDGVFSRDAIDLAMMKVSKQEFHQAVVKARVAYGNNVVLSLQKSIERLLGEDELLSRCIDVMKIKIPKIVIWQNLERLIALSRLDLVDKEVNANIQAVSDERLVKFIDEEMPEIGPTLDYLKDR